MNLDVIKKHEGLRLSAYQDVAGVWTIGYGNTFYEDGKKVKKGDKITKQRAEELLNNTVANFRSKVRELITVALSDNQETALVSFAYNVGIGAFGKSTLLKKVNNDPNDPSIMNEFGKWVIAGGKVWKGLVVRRREEANLYFTL